MDKLISLIFDKNLPSIEDIFKKYPNRGLNNGEKITRIAPSPTGFVHIGTIYMALVSERIAHQLNILIDKINNINFNKYIVDLGGGSIYCNKDFIDSIKQKNIKIIYYYVPLKTIKKRFKKNKREIDSRKLFLNKEGNWENVLENYYNNCFELK